MDKEVKTYIGVEENNKEPYFVLIQSLDEIQGPYPKHSRSINHKYKSNNWLKMNGMTMRRKPFKREYIRYMLDEFCMI